VRALLVVTFAATTLLLSAPGLSIFGCPDVDVVPCETRAIRSIVELDPTGSRRHFPRTPGDALFGIDEVSALVGPQRSLPAGRAYRGLP
jgi:hypothetical protein